MLRDFVSAYRKGVEACYDELPIAKLEQVIDILLRARQEKRKIFIFGNGGSASTASHMAVDHGKGAACPGRLGLRAISLADNIGLITAWANDVCYDSVFKKQLENMLDPGDVVIAISASGNSPNVLRAIEYARERNAVTIGFIGFGGGKLKDLVQVDITTSSKNYGQVEDFHLSLNHIISQYLKGKIEAQSILSTSQSSAWSFFFSDPPSDGIRPAIFLDRDGVINEQVEDGYITRWCEFKFVDGIVETLAALSKLEIPIIVISNQAGIAKGLVSYAALQDITEKFVAYLKSHGSRIDAVYYCPHADRDGCGCRKPRPGLLKEAARDWKLDLSRSVLIGDSARDIRAGRALGCHVMLLKTNGSSRRRPPRIAGVMRSERAADLVNGIHSLLWQESGSAISHSLIRAG